MSGPIAPPLILSGLLVAGSVQAGAVDDLLADYRRKGAGPFDAAAGQALWERSYPSVGGPPRACTSCHTTDPASGGRHAVTGKAIDPIAPSANAERLTDRRRIEKWLSRNFKWALGRECSPQEKGDFLSFLRSQ
jgi:hypothetical protein